MGSPIRLVRRLRLRADSERAVHRAALLLEDALRTASLPDEAGRIVLVRRFALGRIDTQAAPQALALTLERAIARMTAACVYVEDESSVQASAVWFRDALDAHTKLALRLAGGSPVDAWYWPLAVAVWRPHSTVAAALRRIMFSLAALPEAPVALPRWVAALKSAGYIEQIAAALRADDVAPLARAAHVRIPTPMRSRKPIAGDSVAQVSSPRQVVRFASATTLEPFDPRHVLLRALLRAADVQAGKVPGGHNSVVSSQVRSGTTQDQATPDALDAGLALRVPVVNDQESSGRAAGSRRIEASPAPRPEPALPRGSATIERVDMFIASTSEERRIDTQVGGLLFLIPVLQRLGFQAWLEDQPDWMRFDIARLMMATALRRLQIPSDDPAWSLAVWRGPARRIAPRFVAPARWRESLCTGEGAFRLADGAAGATLWDASGRLLLGAWTDVCPRGLLRERRSAEIDTAIIADLDRTRLVSNAWLVACRRWLRRYAGIGLSRLVLRPAQMKVTPTHLDLRFDIGLAELSVRRAGLDIDPGWVPWFERVVTFRYQGQREVID